MGVSETTIGEVVTNMAKVSGSLLASGGIVVGQDSRSEIVFGGAKSDYRIRTDVSPKNMFSTIAKNPNIGLAGNTDPEFVRRLSFNYSYGRLHGVWHADSPFHVTPSTAGASSSLAFNILVNSTQQRKAEMKYNPGSGGSDSFLSLDLEGARKMTVSPWQSQLHGEWVSSSTLLVSDRRLKRNIQSLLEDSVDGDKRSKPMIDNHSPTWLLRQLRPVSYQFRREPAGKKVNRERVEPKHFGFIADEVQQVVPDVVRTVRYQNKDEIKAVAYQDLIALLVAAHQQQVEKVQSLEVTQQHESEAVRSQIAEVRSLLVTQQQEAQRWANEVRQRVEALEDKFDQREEKFHLMVQRFDRQFDQLQHLVMKAIDSREKGRDDSGSIDDEAV